MPNAVLRKPPMNIVRDNFRGIQLLLNRCCIDMEQQRFGGMTPRARDIVNIGEREKFVVL